MTIIKHGDMERFNKIFNQTKRFECPLCGCIFECSVDEWSEIVLYDYECSNQTSVPTATCPTCGKPVQNVVLTFTYSR